MLGHTIFFGTIDPLSQLGENIKKLPDFEHRNEAANSKKIGTSEKEKKSDIFMKQKSAGFLFILS